MKNYMIFLISFLVLVGCQSRRYTFRSVETISNDSSSVQEVHPIKFKIAFGGIQKTQQDVSPTAKFSFKLTNVGNEPITVHPHSYNLIDDEANNFTPVVENASPSIILYPQSSTNFRLSYPFPPGYDLSKIGSFRIAWNYDIAGVKYRRLTKFLKREVEYRTSYYYNYPHFYYFPSFYSNFSFGHRHRRRFRSGFGFGFSGGACY